MSRISILMPAYNAEKYITSAIDSVRGQTFDDWELIIVDDKSSDSTGEICDQYAEKDSRIKVFHNELNHGISETKNIALRHAQGEYIAFCDDDDIMYENALKDNLKLMDKYNADVVRWAYKTIKVDSNGDITGEIVRNCSDGVYLDRTQIFANYDNVHQMLSCDWTGLYSRELLTGYGITFNDDYKYGGEDTEFNISVLNRTESVIMNSNVYYEWFLRRNHSTTAKRNINFCYTMMDVAKKEYNLIHDNCENVIELWEMYEAHYKKLITDYAVRLPEEEKNIIDTVMSNKEWWL